MRTSKNEDMGKVVIDLGRERMEVWVVENGEKTTTAETSWQPDNLSEKLKLIKEKFQTPSVRVLIASDIAGTETVLNVLSSAALAAKLKIEMVEPASLEEHEGDDVLRLAEKEEVEGVEAGVEVVGGEMKTPKTKNMKKVMLIVGGVILLVGVVLGGVMRARSGASEVEPIVITPKATSTPAPTPEPVDWAELKVQILNGSGVTGEAGVVSKILEGVGFESEMITAGNADSYDYTKAEVRVKTGLSEQVYQAIAEALKADYQVMMGEELAENEEYEVIVIVGVRVGE